jgi:tryptophanase
LGCARGGAILCSDEVIFEKMKELVPLYEGFLTYGGMSVREMEAIAVGLEEAMDETAICQAPNFIQYMVDSLEQNGIPVVTPPGALGCHLDASQILDHIKGEHYPAGALAVALYLASGVRGMERGTMSSTRDENGNDILSDMELVRLALPRRVFTLSQVKYVVDRIVRLYRNRHLIGGLKFIKEPKVLRFFFGKLVTLGGWEEKFMKIMREENG